MTKQRKWTTITSIVVLIVAGLLAWNLYYHYQHTKKQQSAHEKVKLDNPNVKLFENITYNSHIPGSQLDIMTPEDVDKNSKLPVIFWMHGGGYVAGDKQYKNPLLAQKPVRALSHYHAPTGTLQ